MIDWKVVQLRLTAAGYPCGAPDGAPGIMTFTALYACAAGRKADAAIALRGKAAAARFVEFGMTTGPRIACFLSQCSNETGGFTRFEEDLRYSAKTLLAQWPLHFTPAQAAAAVGNPIEIASRAYGGRMGNAPYPSRDGYLFRGRFDIQNTGKAEYAAAGQSLGIDLISNPDALPPEISPLVALDYFRRNNLNAYADAGNYDGQRRAANGGGIGLVNVAKIRARLLEIMA